MASILALVIAGLILFFLLETDLGGCLLRLIVAVIIFYAMVFFLGIWFVGTVNRDM